jgi:hypothetical protein
MRKSHCDFQPQTRTSKQPKLLPIYPQHRNLYQKSLVRPRQGSRKDGKSVTVCTITVIFLRQCVSYAGNDLTEQKTHIISFLVGSYVKTGNITLCRTDEHPHAQLPEHRNREMETDFSVFVLPCVIRGLAKGHSRSSNSHYIPRRRFTNSQKQEMLYPMACSAR